MARLRRLLRGLARRAAFTVSELLIVVAVSTVGFVALADLQTSTIHGRAEMQKMLQAVNLAEMFLDDLRLEFSRWTPAQQLTPGLFPHLADLPVGPTVGAGAQTIGSGVKSGPGWISVEYQGGSDRRVSLVGDVHPLGYNAGIYKAINFVGFSADPFCLFYRLTWLNPGETIRAEVEVAWAFHHANQDEFQTCDTLTHAQLDRARNVTMTTTLNYNRVFRR